MTAVGAILSGVLALAAFAAWIVAAISALQIVVTAPSGKKFAAYWDLGWWRHAALRESLGPSADKPLVRYRFAFVAFFACVLGLIFLVFALTLQQ